MYSATSLNFWRKKNKTALLFASAAAIVTGGAAYFLEHDLGTFFGGMAIVNAGIAAGMIALWPQPKRSIATVWFPPKHTLH